MVESNKANSAQDPALKSLLERMPPEVANSFTEEQLSHLHSALGARSWKKHSLDIRSTFPIPFAKSRVYFVLLMGRNRRELTRREKQISAITFALFVAVFIGFSTLFGLLVLYLIKSALGIDIFKGYSFGVWKWFKELWK
ncbi:3-phosphoshikimate 1-carboxyvinyltransferase [Alteromonas lipolytica]|uniref:3-phosphoshikimate 1-carboxyvinyltransferase n=1 Tax=Alteromonas lipolytica TaxID=1856405 RepID=A0A1E8FD73_9ALTE|nr:3-phosphoshikimate 1-carboxyvinyltransferase [Alteromonas lipolytica]OFI33871.1 3-phosphoshikimate 1-carboxyvinyltransferase [Alteromonas lipolytica]GGF67628.1 hypothetical protein GCM10011338_19790 [Alteromonas lipolytica]